MKKWIAILLTVTLAFSLAACGTKDEYDPTDDLCPGKQPGVSGNAPTQVEGFDPNEDMSFTTKDVDGKTVTNEIFAGTERGVWLVFWQTDSKKSAAELEKLNGLTDIAAENGYKILGVVMDGEKNADKAKEMTNGLNFDNILWNDSMALRYEGIVDFFTKEYFEENKVIFEQFNPVPQLGNPISTRTNSRGQMQTACYLVQLESEKIVETWKNNDSNATYEELVNEGNALVKGE